jgi:hypothetical protein
MKISKQVRHLLSLISTGAFLLIAFATDKGSEDKSLNVNIEYRGFEIVITNNDVFDYKNATLKLNNKYRIENCEIGAGKTYSVGMGQFADLDGNRFNFLALEPQSFYIRCELENGEHGMYYGETR